MKSAWEIRSYHICVCFYGLLKEVRLIKKGTTVGIAVQLYEGLTTVMTSVLAVYREQEKRVWFQCNT